MSFRILFYFTIITLCISCVSLNDKQKITKTKNTSSVNIPISNEYEILSINCDTIYKGKNYHLELKSINPIQEKNSTTKYVFSIVV